MKKLSVLFTALLVVALLVGCVQTPPVDNTPVPNDGTAQSTTTTTQSGPTTVPVSELLTINEAKDIALKTVGIDEKDAKGLEIDLDYETKEKRWDYEIDFYVDNVEYNIEIDAADGKVIHFKKDHDDAPTVQKVPTTKKPTASATKTEAPTTTTTTQTTEAPTTSETAAPTTSATKADRISPKEAKSIALNKAETTEDKVSHYRYEVDYDDDQKRWEYEIDFYVGKVEYDVEIDAVSGKILKFEKETEDDKHKATATTKPTFVDKELVRDYAVLCAGVSEDKIKDYEVELDYNEKTKVWEYEVTFKVGRLEYDIVIDAVSGNTISFHKELDD